MPTVQVQAQLSTDILIEAASQLSADELERFAEQVMLLRARRKAPSLSHEEAMLLQKINAGVPNDVQQRFNQLRNKLESETIQPQEHQELLTLVEEIENIEAQRIQYLTRKT